MFQAKICSCSTSILDLILQLCNVSRVCKVDTSTRMFGKLPIVPACLFLSKNRDTTADRCHIQPVTQKDLHLCQKLFCIYSMLFITSKWKVFIHFCCRSSCFRPEQLQKLWRPSETKNMLVSSATWETFTTRVTIFGDSDSTRVRLRKMVTRLDSSHVFHGMTRLESQSMTRDTCHLCKIAETLIDKPSLFCIQRNDLF